MQRLFEAFTRVTQRDGLGIDLFIVRQGIRMLGRPIEVSSAACRGSRFSIFASRAE
ncbi:hypothetical protein [Mesorhizobium sp. M0166]|uniref:hypothetical protein n=1 Tax=Mesorhizobium sp. M0166 TaxID=2956902 RepID=UPI00333C1813